MTKRQTVSWPRRDHMPQTSHKEGFLSSEAKHQINGAVLWSFFLFLPLKNMPLPFSIPSLKNTLHSNTSVSNKAWIFNKSVILTFLTKDMHDYNQIDILFSFSYLTTTMKKHYEFWWWGGEKKIIWVQNTSREHCDLCETNSVSTTFLKTEWTVHSKRLSTVLRLFCFFYTHT